MSGSVSHCGWCHDNRGTTSTRRVLVATWQALQKLCVDGSTMNFPFSSRMSGWASAGAVSTCSSAQSFSRSSRRRRESSHCCSTQLPHECTCQQTRCPPQHRPRAWAGLSRPPVVSPRANALTLAFYRTDRRRCRRERCSARDAATRCDPAQGLCCIHVTPCSTVGISAAASHIALSSRFAAQAAC